MLVERDVTHCSIGLDQRLSSISVVHVPIDDQHLPASGSLSMSGRDHHVVYQTKPHASCCQGVMPRRPNGSEGMPVPGNRVIHRGEHGTGGTEHSCPAITTQDGIEKERASSSLAHGLEPGQIGSGVNREQRIAAGRLGFVERDLRLVSDPGEHSTQARWCLRVLRPRIVL
jgi:hypothetical protein